MPLDKNKEVRFRIIDKLLSSSKNTLENLLKKVNEKLDYEDYPLISKRTLQDDLKGIKMMLEEKYPDIEDVEELFGTEKLGRAKLWSYANTRTSIFKELTPFENNQLKQLLAMVKSLGGLNGIEGFSDTLDRLTKKLKLAEDDQRKIMLIDRNEQYVGNDNIKELYDHIYKKQAVRIEYQSFNSEKRKYDKVSPQVLKEYNNRWFLMAWNHEVERITNYALDRILGIECVESEYVDKQIDWERFFSSIYGVSRVGEPEEVKLRCNDQLFFYMESKPIVPNQQMDYVEKIITLKVYLNYEFKQLIYSHQKDIEVLEPQSLKEEIEGRYREIVEGKARS
ncbi:MAG: helix-turn-helix transcriptional regulator [Mangrovibacterium sp.]